METHATASQAMLDDPSLMRVEDLVQLGSFDQAHFIKDFKALVGCSPAEYAAVCASVPAAA